MKTQRSYTTYYELQLGRDVTDSDKLAIECLMEARPARPAYLPSSEGFFIELPSLLKTASYEAIKKKYREYRQKIKAQENAHHTEKEILSSKICF